MKAGKVLTIFFVLAVLMCQCNAMDAEPEEQSCDQDTANSIAFEMVQKYLEHKGSSDGGRHNLLKALQVVKDRKCDVEAIEEYFIGYNKLKQRMRLQVSRLNLESVIDIFGYQDIKASCMEPEGGSLFRKPKSRFQVSGGFFGSFMGYRRMERSCALSAETIDKVFQGAAKRLEEYESNVKDLVLKWRYGEADCSSEGAARLTAILKAIMADPTSVSHTPFYPLDYLFCLHRDQDDLAITPGSMRSRRNDLPPTSVRTEAAEEDDKCGLRAMGSVTAEHALHFYADDVRKPELYWPEFGLNRVMTAAMKEEFETGDVWGTKIVRNIMVVRGSSRQPDDVFTRGFVAHPNAGAPRGLQCSDRRDDIFKLKSPEDAEKAMVYHTGPDNNSCWFVSMTLAPQIGIKFAGQTPLGWVYLAVAREGIELVEHNGEGEVLMPYGCPGVDILAARKVLTGRHGYTGNVVFNRRFAGILDPDTESEMLRQFLCWTPPSE